MPLEGESSQARHQVPRIANRTLDSLRQGSQMRYRVESWSISYSAVAVFVGEVWSSERCWETEWKSLRQELILPLIPEHAATGDGHVGRQRAKLEHFLCSEVLQLI